MVDVAVCCDVGTEGHGVSRYATVSSAVLESCMWTRVLGDEYKNLEPD